MKCDSCNGTGNSAKPGQRCFQCNGSGEMCDSCGEALTIDEVDLASGTCQECLDAELEE